jgi:threonine dehydrogenase-like Zn-dependent dehydrogenase
MKAKMAFLHGPGDLRIEYVDLPKLKPDQVLVKVGACGICGSDLECFEGLSKEGRYDLGPYTPGHEWGGEVVEIGKTIWRTLDITGSGGTKNFARRTIRFMDRIRDAYDFAALNTHHFSFEKIHEAFEVAIHDKENAFKVMLTF